MFWVLIWLYLAGTNWLEHLSLIFAGLLLGIWLVEIIDSSINGMWLRLVERTVRGREVKGSNPFISTK